MNSDHELTAFVREVVLPGGPDALPRVDPRHSRFRLASAPSAIHRWGIFAAEPIPARRRVIEYCGQRIGQAEVARRSVRPNLYIFWLNPRAAIDGAIGGSGAEFVNHCCDPNLYARVSRGHVHLVSLRRIAAGEELSFDYRIIGEGGPVACHCGSPKCRGFMNPPWRA